MPILTDNPIDGRRATPDQPSQDSKPDILPPPRLDVIRGSFNGTRLCASMRLYPEDGFGGALRLNARDFSIEVSLVATREDLTALRDMLSTALATAKGR